MDEKYLRALAKWSTRVFSEMSGTEVVSTWTKKDERTTAGFTVGQAVEYEHVDKAVKGHFILGLRDEAMAVIVAAAIAEGMGLEPITEMGGPAYDILGELVNTVVGRTIAEWETMGLPVRFGPPIPIDPARLPDFEGAETETYLIVLSLALYHVIFRVTFSQMPEGASAGKRVLVVDDSAVIRALLGKALAQGGYQVELAENGLDAVEKFKARRPDACIMDLVMPEMGGLDAIMEIRQWAPEAKFIILTSSSKKDELVTAKTLGVAHYLIKPVKVQTLLDAIKKMLG